VRKFNIAYILIAFAAIAQGVMWVNVFTLLHFGALAYVAGFPGIAIVGIVTRGANQLPRTQSKRARYGGTGLLALLTIAETAVLGTANYHMLDDFILAYGASFVITVTLIFGALVERSLVPVEKSATTEKPPRKSKATKRQPITDKQLNDYWLRNPKATNTEVAAHFGVTRQAIAKRREKLYSVHNAAARSDR